MREPEPPRVEHLPGRRAGVALARAVHAVAEHRVARRREVHADLVRAAGLQAHRDEARARQPLEGAEPRDRPAPGLAGARHAPPEARRAHEVGLVGSGVRRRPGDQGHVLPLDGVLPETVLEKVQRGAVAREDDRARGVLVDPVDDARVGPSAVAVLQIEEGPAPEGVLLARLGRHRQEARLLVDDQHVAVLVEHRQPRANAAARGPAGVKLEARVGAHLGPRLVEGRSVGVDPPGAHGLPRRAAREPEGAGRGEVEPHGEGLGTRTSTKKPGSPIRAPSRAPGP